MTDLAVMWEWAAFAARWLHVITAIAWIGSSFYFIALDLGLRKHKGLPEGVLGEEWQVHGGGFYHINKYVVAPPGMPEHLVWFKWESYWTWMSGFLMLAIVYYVGADLYLVDPRVLDISAPVAIAISVASLTLGWLLYDQICRSPLRRYETALMVVLFLVLVAMAWGYTQVFSGRAAFLHLGAFTATIMSANVFFIIIPNQKKIVGALKAGEAPDPALGAQSKVRSVHNNYLTLPVIFLMLSNHYPLAFATQYNWVIAALVFLMGVVIRHYFNTRHAGKGNPHWTWAATVVLFIAIAWLSTAPKLPGIAQPSPAAQAMMARPQFEEVARIVQGRCAMCHSQTPGWDGVPQAPKHVMFDTEAEIAERAHQIYIQAGLTDAMPPGNVSMMEPGERAAIVDWFRNAQGDP